MTTRKQALARGQCAECAAFWVRAVCGHPIWPEGSCGGERIDDRQCKREQEREKWERRRAAA